MITIRNLADNGDLAVGISLLVFAGVNYNEFVQQDRIWERYEEVIDRKINGLASRDIYLRRSHIWLELQQGQLDWSYGE